MNPGNASEVGGLAVLMTAALSDPSWLLAASAIILALVRLADAMVRVHTHFYKSEAQDGDKEDK